MKENIFIPGIDFHLGIISNIEAATAEHNHDFYEIFLVTTGRVCHIINSHQQNLITNNLVFIRKDDMHYYKKSNEKYEFINIAFTENIFNQLVQFYDKKIIEEKVLKPSLPPTINITSTEHHLCQLRIEKINTIAQYKKKTLNLHFKKLITDLFFYFLEKNETFFNTDQPEWLTSLYLQMQKKENFQQGIKKLYFLANMSPEHICRCFKKYYKQTPTAFINELRLNYTANLLNNTDRTITDISLEAGFNNLSHFYHLFQNKYNMTPGDFRKTHQRKSVNI